ncbi:tRNA 2-thiouridine(34) synthase MnmA [Candidatus Nomurabacteria bacterium]|nr:tRNA 2-thiouridine(34) synthase MnmA [Candidatus Nomurabacteria bacterium]
MKKKTKKVFVGISGGVDSSVAAYLLKKQGYEVHGIFVKTWSPDWLPCTWVEEKRDAMRVCAHLNIPFHFLDAEQEYKNGVAEYMINEYKAGRTPNPDVLCNRVIKFGVMWDYAKEHGADFIATGHYAQTDGINLMKGIDISKDQSYFLWMLTKEDLAHTLLPIGHLRKSEVRDLATKARLFTGEKKDSQGICFLGDVDMREFLSHYIEQEKGVVKNIEGKIVGEHHGIWFYTLGERHGFHITKQSTDQKPYYIVGKDINENILIVSHTPTSQIKSKKQIISLRNTNWQKLSKSKVEAQIRYHGELIPTKIIDQETVEITHEGTVAEGQSLVLYKKDELVGGGIIEKVS